MGIARAMLLFVLAAVTSAWSFAWVAGVQMKTSSVEAPRGDSCCPIKKPAPESSDHAEGECPCPIDCGPWCGGMPTSAVMTVPAGSPVLLPGFTLLTFPASIDQPAEGATHDILHVPRS